MSKKVLYLLGITLMMMSFSACLKNNTPQPQTESSKEISLWIVRHGKTMLNTTNRVQGWADAPLTPAGIEVIEYLANGLHDVPFIAAYSSDSGRARETAMIILQHHSNQNLTLQDDWRLREFNFGNYEGEYNIVMWQDIANMQNQTLEEWTTTMTPSNFADSVAKLDSSKSVSISNWQAENFATIAERLMQALDDIVQQHPEGGNILIVSHGLSMLTIAKTIDPSLNFSGHLTNGSILIIKYQPEVGYSVETINDMSYVEKGKILQL